MNLKKQKLLASRALGVSHYRVKFDAMSLDSQRALKELISRQGVRELVKDKVIKVVPKKGNSRTHANYVAEQKDKGRRQGHGSRKGKPNARGNTRDKWIVRIRALRRVLSELREQGKMPQKVYKDMYAKAGGNFFRNKRHMFLYCEQNNLLVEGKKNGI